MISIRPAQWPRDIVPLSRLDLSFETDRIYRVDRDELSFRLAEEVLPRPLKKRYPLDPANQTERETWHFAVLAEKGNKIVGFAAVEHIAWNNRAHLRHLYVARKYRCDGVGRQLLQAVEDYARSVNCRSLWLETQNINYGAVQFYLRSGFVLCGLDTGLYDPAKLSTGDTALFFEKPLP